MESSRPVIGVRTAVVAVVVLLTMSACSSGSSSRTQPGPHSTSFTRGVFDEIPRYPDSTPASPRRRVGGVTVRSYTVTDATPAEVLGWYGSHLPGWELIQRPAATGSTDWRGAWQRNRRQLLISAAPSPTAADRAQLGGASQISIQLGDRGRALVTATTSSAP